MRDFLRRWWWTLKSHGPPIQTINVTVVKRLTSDRLTARASCCAGLCCSDVAVHPDLSRTKNMAAGATNI